MFLVQVRADIPESNYGGNVQISCMLPKACTRLAKAFVLVLTWGLDYTALKADSLGDHRLSPAVQSYGCDV